MRSQDAIVFSENLLFEIDNRGWHPWWTFYIQTYNRKQVAITTVVRWQIWGQKTRNTSYLPLLKIPIELYFNSSSSEEEGRSTNRLPRNAPYGHIFFKSCWTSLPIFASTLFWSEDRETPDSSLESAHSSESVLEEGMVGQWRRMNPQEQLHWKLLLHLYPPANEEPTPNWDLTVLWRKCNRRRKIPTVLAAPIHVRTEHFESVLRSLPMKTGDVHILQKMHDCDGRDNIAAYKEESNDSNDVGSSLCHAISWLFPTWWLTRLISGKRTDSQLLLHWIGEVVKTEVNKIRHLLPPKQHENRR